MLTYAWYTCRGEGQLDHGVFDIEFKCHDIHLFACLFWNLPLQRLFLEFVLSALLFFVNISLLASPDFSAEQNKSSIKNLTEDFFPNFRTFCIFYAIIPILIKEYNSRTSDFFWFEADAISNIFFECLYMAVGDTELNF